MIAFNALRRLMRPPTRGNELGESEACELFSAMLDGGIGEPELGALLAALALRPLAAAELAGFSRAARNRINRLPAPARTGATARRPVVVPSYGGARHHPNLMPLLALALARFGVPTLVHGPLEGHGSIASASVLRELGILPSSSLRQLQTSLAESGIAYAPTALLLPSLAQLLSLRGRLGFENCAHWVARLVDPFGGEGLMLVPAGDPLQRERFAEAIAALGDEALLFDGMEGEAYPDPRQRPAIEHFSDGARRLLFAAEPAAVPAKSPRLPRLPEEPQARGTARWIALALEGKEALPSPLANLLACCLYAAGYADDFNQSKAIVAVRSHVAAEA